MLGFGALVLAACTGSGGAAKESAAGWTDPSPHRVSFVSVAPGVRLEVLDWGGSGPPLVFLSGLQDVAHGFDDFAPEFTHDHHVLAITRRGYGASSQPHSGYDIAGRVADLRSVLDSLGLQRVALVGHSIAGDELTAFAGMYPARVAGLVYLDAAYDHSEVRKLLAGYPAPPPMLARDSASPRAVREYFHRVSGMRIPEAQLRAIGRYDSAGHLVADVTPPAIDSLILVSCGHPTTRPCAPRHSLFMPWWTPPPSSFPTMLRSTHRIRMRPGVSLRHCSTGLTPSAPGFAGIWPRRSCSSCTGLITTCSTRIGPR